LLLYRSYVEHKSIYNMGWHFVSHSKNRTSNIILPRSRIMVMIHLAHGQN